MICDCNQHHRLIISKRFVQNERGEAVGGYGSGGRNSRGQPTGDLLWASDAPPRATNKVEVTVGSKPFAIAINPLSPSTR